MLTKEQILSASDAKTKAVPVPEWGGEVCIKTMSGAERDRWEASAIVGGVVNRENIRARLLAATLCDEAGKLLFTEADVEALSAKSAPALVRLFSAASKLNALNDEDVDDLAKNSSAGPDGSSPSTLPATSAAP